jgi:hypothetical protein
MNDDRRKMGTFKNYTVLVAVADGRSAAVRVMQCSVPFTRNSDALLTMYKSCSPASVLFHHQRIRLSFKEHLQSLSVVYFTRSNSNLLSCRNDLQVIPRSSSHRDRRHRFKLDILCQCSGCHYTCSSVPLSQPR